MKQAVFYVYNQGRKRCFSVETSVYKDRLGKYVVKSAVFNDSIQHIEDMLKSYNKLLKAISKNKQFALVSPQKIRDGVIRFDYINGKSAERALIERILEGDEKGILDITEIIYKLINGLPSVFLNPTASDKFIEVFGNNYNRDMECVESFVIDLNLDNFIIDSDGIWHLYDYEWVFNFPIPKKMFFQRFLFWFFIMRYNDLSLMAGNKIRIVEIGRGLYIPKVVYSKYQNYFNTIEEMIDAEWNLQKYTQINSPLINDGHKLNVFLHDEAVELSSQDVERLILNNNFLHCYEDKLIKTASEEEILEIKTNLENTRQELSSIKDSNLYRYLSIIRRIKKIFTNSHSK